MAARRAGSSTPASRSITSGGSGARGLAARAGELGAGCVAIGRTRKRSELAGTPSLCTRSSKSALKKESS
jgi:hypothetical protein